MQSTPEEFIEKGGAQGLSLARSVIFPTGDNPPYAFDFVEGRALLDSALAIGDAAQQV